MTPEEEQAELEWEALKAIYVVGLENTNSNSLLGDANLRVNESVHRQDVNGSCERGRSLERLARESLPGVPCGTRLGVASIGDDGKQPRQLARVAHP